MKKYESYKESNIETIGVVPIDWNVTSIKYIAEIIGRIGFRGYTVDDIVTEGEGAISLSPSNILNQKLDLVKKTFLSWKKYEESPEIKINEGDVILVKTASVGKVAFVDNLKNYKATLNPQLIVFKNIIIDSKYFYYILISDIIQKKIEGDTNGGVIGTLTQKSINSYKVLSPTRNEQIQIAKYLDYQTGLIDAIIEKKELLVKKLQAQRQAIINEVVTKGLNPNAKMKDSGIEWLGEIPEHWELVKLKYLVNHSTEKGNGLSDFKIALENIESKTGKLIFSESKDFEAELKVFKKGDILFNKLRPYLAKVLLAPKDGECVSELLVFQAIEKEIDSIFLYHKLSSERIISIVDSSTYGAKMPRASIDFILNLPIPIPTKEEQHQISERITFFKSKLDITNEKLNNQIKKLKSYRQSIISEAVTGKIDVRDWVKPEK